MLEQYLGPETFRAGVNLYLKEHQYANATATDFWGAMARSSKMPVDQIMPTFVLQAGEPYVAVEAKCASGKTTLSVSQKRFFNESEAFQQPNDQLWQIPLCVKGVGGSGNAERQCFLIKERQQDVSMKGCAPFVFPNAGGAGYYRFDYDQASLRKIGAEVEKGLTPEERIALLSDDWALVQADQHKVGDYLALGDQLKNTPGHAVLGEFAGKLQTINQYLVNDADRPQFQAWVRKTFSPMMQAAGFEARPNDTPEDKQRRATLFQMLGTIGNDPQVIEEAHTLVLRYMQDTNSVDGTLAGPVVSIAARHGNADLYSQFKAKLKDTKSPELFYRYFYALAQFPETDLLQQTLDWSLTPDVRSQDLRIIGAVTGNPAGEAMGWDFMQKHLDDIRKKTGGGLGGVGVILGVSGRFCDAQRRDQVQEFFKEHEFPGTERNQRQAIESINSCIALRDQQQSNLASWLSQSPIASGSGAGQ
jgi:aminopeptidase N/puromycin-sensitive aminopeptidase